MSIVVGLGAGAVFLGRPVLWGLTGKGDGQTRFIANDNVSGHLQRIVPLFDLIIGTEEEFLIAGGSDDLLTALRESVCLRM